MSICMPRAQLLIEARTRSGLSQRALARRARTAQSVIARIENGTVSPRILRLTPEQRLLELRTAARFFDSAVRKRR